MSERIVLLTVRRQSDTSAELLVRGSQSSWAPVNAEISEGELPVETAVRAVEELFGPQSFCSIWLLGRDIGNDRVSHVFCLDLATVAVSTPLPTGYIWLSMDQVSSSFSGVPERLIKKLEAYRR